MVPDGDSVYNSDSIACLNLKRGLLDQNVKLDHVGHQLLAILYRSHTSYGLVNLDRALKHRTCTIRTCVHTCIPSSWQPLRATQVNPLQDTGVCSSCLSTYSNKYTYMLSSVQLLFKNKRFIDFFITMYVTEKVWCCLVSDRHIKVSWTHQTEVNQWCQHYRVSNIMNRNREFSKRKLGVAVWDRQPNRNRRGYICCRLILFDRNQYVLL